MIEYLDQLDRQLMLFLNYDGGALQDAIWWFISGKLSWLPLYCFLLVCLYRISRPDWRKLAVLVIITILVVVLSDQIASGLIKHWVCRPRPSRLDSGIADLIHIVNGYRGGHYGFVSSHASNTIGIALWFGLLFRQQPPFTNPIANRTIWTVLILWVVLNCYSRIYLGVHYPGDIIGGLIVGVLSALFCYTLIYKHCKKRQIC